MTSAGYQAAQENGLTLSDREYVREIGVYYDLATPAYLSNVGTTIQSGLVEIGVDDKAPNAVAARLSNLYCAVRAGIKAGDRVLDAGCGVCGPSIDIAGSIPGVRIDGVTLSLVQAVVGTRMVNEAGLSNAITVSLADYHNLPFEADTYDVVLFLETAGYSYDLEKLFAGIFRVMKPGGTLYIKDVFCREGVITTQEKSDLDQFDRIYVYRTTTMSRVAEVLGREGFQAVSTRYLGRHDGSYASEGQVAVGNRFYKAMLQTRGGQTTLTDFGKLHAYNFTHLPIVFGEVLARKAL